MCSTFFWGFLFPPNGVPKISVHCPAVWDPITWLVHKASALPPVRAQLRTGSCVALRNHAASSAWGCLPKRSCLVRLGPRPTSGTDGSSGTWICSVTRERRTFPQWSSCSMILGLVEAERLTWVYADENGSVGSQVLLEGPGSLLHSIGWTTDKK